MNFFVRVNFPPLLRSRGMTKTLTTSELLKHGPRVQKYMLSTMEKKVAWDEWHQSFRLLPDPTAVISLGLGEPTGKHMGAQGTFLVWDSPRCRVRLWVETRAVDVYVIAHEDTDACLVWLFEQVPAVDATDLCICLEAQAGSLVIKPAMTEEMRENIAQRLSQLEELRQRLGW